MMTFKSGAAVASAAAFLAMSALSTAAIAADTQQKSISASDQVECYGINACKGQSECKSGDHACKGLNQCKGHGFKTVAAKECLAQDGKILLK